LRDHPASVRVTLSFVHWPSNNEVAAREARGHQGGAPRQLSVRQDFDPAETSSAIPRLRATEVTQPLELAQRGRGPDHQDIVRLDRGEIQSLCFADHYRIGRPLGRGGTAIVFGGENLDLGQPVAVKILVPHDAECHPAMHRFMCEALIGTRIRHENVVEVFDYGSTPEGLVYLVMELLEGEDLRTLIDRHGDGLPWARVRSIMLQICEGLGAVHAAGVVHQDLKPSNCFSVLDEDGERIKLIDFGVSVAIGERESPRLIVGTPQYMSPEQARGVLVDARSDIYSAGIILCELLTGKVPFNGSPITVLSAQIEDQPPTLQQLAQAGVCIEPALQRIYEQAVAKDPAQRFSSVEEMAAAIRKVAAKEPFERSGELEPDVIALQPVTDAGELVRGRSWWNLAAVVRSRRGSGLPRAEAWTEEHGGPVEIGSNPVRSLSSAPTKARHRDQSALRDDGRRRGADCGPRARCAGTP